MIRAGGARIRVGKVSTLDQFHKSNKYLGV